MGVDSKVDIWVWHGFDLGVELLLEIPRSPAVKRCGDSLERTCFGSAARAVRPVNYKLVLCRSLASLQ